MTNYTSLLFPYAYNILGSAEDAKDTVQDVLTNHFAQAREGIENEKAYLIKSVINHAINVKTRRKPTVQPDIWLPEPVATESADANLHLKDILSYSLLVLLEKLNPKERAVFILKESFDYTHEEIAEILGMAEENSRQLLSRAKSKLFKPGPSKEINLRDQRTNTLLQNFIDAIRDRNLEKLEGLLAQDIAFYADGGGKVKVVRTICNGQSEVAQLLIYVYEKFQSRSTVKIIELNHQPALLYYNGDRLVTAQIVGISPETGEIIQLSTVVDPQKLKNLTNPA